MLLNIIFAQNRVWFTPKSVVLFQFSNKSLNFAHTDERTGH